LWPERENPLVVKANRLVDRGFIEGIQTGQGNNGWQFLLTGTRAAQGQTFGIGYRRADLFDDALPDLGQEPRGVLGSDADVLLIRGRVKECGEVDLSGALPTDPLIGGLVDPGHIERSLRPGDRVQRADVPGQVISAHVEVVAQPRSLSHVSALPRGVGL
jgi:hypothetical protein